MGRENSNDDTVVHVQRPGGCPGLQRDYLPAEPHMSILLLPFKLDSTAFTRGSSNDRTLVVGLPSRAMSGLVTECIWAKGHGRTRCFRGSEMHYMSSYDGGWSGRTQVTGSSKPTSMPKEESQAERKKDALRAIARRGKKG